MWVLLVLAVGIADQPASPGQRFGLVGAPTMQEFASRESCEIAARRLYALRERLPSHIRGGLELYMDCVPK